MGILDLYITPIRKEYRELLVKRKAKSQRAECQHNFTYEKWVYRGRKEGVKDSFHFKEVCTKCGYGRLIPRTKEVFLIVSKQKWRYSKPKRKALLTMAKSI